MHEKCKVCGVNLYVLEST